MAQTEFSAGEGATVPASPRVPGWAWGICWLMFASTVLNYMDRQAMALVRPQILSQYHLTNEDFGWVLAAFQLTYAVFQVPSGYLVDRWDVRWVYAAAVAWWSLAAMASAFAPTLGALLILRALLGVGESFNWPCALRTTAKMLPPSDRSLGNGIFNSGAAIGAVLTPLVVPFLTERYGWPTAFLTVGTLGFVWVAVWLWLLRGERGALLAPRRSPRPQPVDDFAVAAPGVSGLAQAAFGGVATAALLVALSAFWFGLPALWWGITVLMVGLPLAALVVPLHALKGADWAQSLGEVVRQRRFWVLVLVSITINVCWHFLVNWLPSYLKEDRDLTGLVGLVGRFSKDLSLRGDPKYIASGLLTAVLFVAADLGNLGGGACTRVLAARGLTPVRARMIVMSICTLLITGGALVGMIRSDLIVLVLIGLMAMATAAFMANYFAFTQEVSAQHTGLIVGILGGLGNLFAGGFFPLVGKVKDVTGSFAPLFVLVGLLPYLGMAALLLGWGEATVDAGTSRDGLAVNPPKSPS